MGQAGAGNNPGRPRRLPIDAQQSSTQQADLVACKHCSRTFNSDRIRVHERICAKTGKRKQKQFNSFKQRISGTGAENFLKKGKPSLPPKKLESSNWRSQHQDFMNRIKNARDKPHSATPGGARANQQGAPPPLLDTSNYIQCPHCGRKFNETAAARHIPACETMIHNKPKPTTSKK